MDAHPLASGIKQTGFTSIISVRLVSFISMFLSLSTRLHTVPEMLSLDGWGFEENVDIWEDKALLTVCTGRVRWCQHTDVIIQQTCAVILFSPLIWDFSAEKGGSLMYSPSCCEPNTALLRSGAMWLDHRHTFKQNHSKKCSACSCVLLTCSDTRCPSDAWWWRALRSLSPAAAWLCERSQRRPQTRTGEGNQATSLAKQREE